MPQKPNNNGRKEAEAASSGIIAQCSECGAYGQLVPVYDGAGGIEWRCADHILSGRISTKYFQ